MGQCIAKNTEPQRPGEGKKKGSSEETFRSLRQMQKVDDKEHLVIQRSDFIMEHKGKAFNEVYKADPQILGEGAFGKVQKCVKKGSGEDRAVKILDKTEMEDKEKIRLKFEIDILKNLDHPNILRLYEVFEDKKYIYLVTELCQGGELFDEILKRKTFTEKDAAVVIKQVLSAIAHCHENNVAHRDLKPENILLNTKNNTDIVKIIDFGTSQVFSTGEKMTQGYGTAYYVAPEVLEGQYTEKCDIWSIGVILFVLLSGVPPFNGQSDDEIFEKVRQGKYSFSDASWKRRTQDSMDLIKKMLTFNSEKRITAEQALQHNWIHQQGVQSIDYTLTSQALENLKTFRAEQKLQQAAITFIVSQLSTKKEQEELYKTFKAFDKDSNGKISKDELIEGYKIIYKNMDEKTLIQEAEKLFAAADVDGSGEIDYSEWAIATINKRGILSEEKLKGAFELFDKDGSGSISADEIKQVLGVGKKFGKENIWDEIIKEVDVNGDGEISFEEFKLMMSKFLGGTTK